MMAIAAAMKLMLIFIFAAAALGDNPHTCPVGCSCELHIVKCVGIGLKKVPKFHEWSDSWKGLVLDQNKIQSLPKGAFENLTALEHVSLQHNDIKVISPRALKGLINLKILYLDENFIHDLPADVFKPCPKLEYLSLMGNFICNLTHISDALQDLGNVHTLDLSFNVGTDYCDSTNLDATVPVGIKRMTKLRKLIIGDNEFGNITRDHFVNLAGIRLVHLDLNGTNIVDVTDDVFTDLAHLRILSLSYQSLGAEGWIEKALTSLPKGNLTVLRLRSVFNFHKVPSKRFKTLERFPIKFLDFGENTRAFKDSVPKQFFKHTSKVEELYLDGCVIPRIDHLAFSGLHKLRWLHLQNNVISCVDYCYFLRIAHELPKLQYLDLSGNVIMGGEYLSIKDTVFPALEGLSLRNNRIRTTALHTFMLANMKYLDLSENPLEHIKPRTFMYMNTLSHLKLNKLQLTSLKNDTFAGLDDLRMLILSDNRIKYIESDALSHLKNLIQLEAERSFLISGKGTQTFPELDELNLEIINLSENHLEDIPSFVSRQQNLTKLILRYNKISIFSSEIYKHYKHLQFLDLSYNDIVELNPRSVLELLPVASVDLSGNPFECSCASYDFITKLQSSKVHFLNPDDMKCVAPAKLRGTNILHYTPSQWECSIKYVMIPIFVAIPMLLWCVVCILRMRAKRVYRANGHPRVAQSEAGDISPRFSWRASFRRRTNQCSEDTVKLVESPL